jgi:16S rRNA C967 or C1407 C5-methylase (RsmB/RsmF family)/NOL1/NOP2/fmu family ribosome biogenesis protein
MGDFDLHPDFVRRTAGLLGGEYGRFEEALLGVAGVSVRVNGAKWDGEPSADRVAWCGTGFFLEERRAFTFDPLLHGGAYYVQEAASMFVEAAVREYVKEPVRCLDLCAAPGGKATLLSAALPAGSLLVCNEVVRGRRAALLENLIKWGDPAVAVTGCDAAELGRLDGFFDVVVADLPCSGEGMFRKDPASRAQWSPAAVTLCAARQRRIIRDIWGALREGGLLIYSTCTFNTEENEDNIDFIVKELGGEALAVPSPTAWGVTGALKGDNAASRFLPHRARGEGFFLSVVRKAGGGDGRRPGKGVGLRGYMGGKIPAAILAAARSYMLGADDFRFERRGDMVFAVPAVHGEDYAYLSGRLGAVSAGVCVGEIKGDDLIPGHPLAMSVRLNRQAFAVREAERDEAIRYLRKEAIGCCGERGYALVVYRGLPLGFVKQLGSRSNNLYPRDWRIRSQRNSL